MREMKNSGIPWIGEIPVEWNITQVRHLYKIGRGRVIAQTELEDNGKYPVYSSQTKDNGCLGYINSYDFDVDQLTWTTDGANAGTVFLRSGKHNCTNVCGTLQPLNELLDLRYQKYALEHIAFYHKRADTNGFKIMNNEMAAIHTIVPPLRVQKKIADYLDSKCAKIDSIIEKQQAIIEKLKEYKLSVITEAVTKGLNPNVEMKDSGVEWIGKVPMHWKKHKLADLSANEKYSMVDGPFGSDMKNEEYVDEGVPIIQLTNIKPYNHYVDELKFVTEEKAIELSRHSAYAGEIVIAKMMPAGRACILKDCYEKYIVAADAIRCKCNNTTNPDFVVYCLNSYGMTECELASKGTTRVRISLDISKHLTLFIPEKEEQDVIADYLNKECNLVDYKIEKIKNIIDKLQEYKKSLIYEVVTGKKEV